MMQVHIQSSLALAATTDRLVVENRILKGDIVVKRRFVRSESNTALKLSQQHSGSGGTQRNIADLADVCAPCSARVHISASSNYSVPISVI